MKLSEPDALIVLYLVVNGPSSSYQIAKDFLAAGVVKPPRSGFDGVRRAVSARLDRLVREGYLSKDGSLYFPTDMVVLDNLKVVGDVFHVDLGPCLVFHTNNGHHVVFEVDRLIEPLSDDALRVLFPAVFGEQRSVREGIKGSLTE